MSFKTILLTGAGFSRDFGGFLRKHMWSTIFNNRSIKDNYPRINELANKIKDYDYESIYLDVHGGLFSPEEIKALDDAFVTAYNQLDENIRKAFGRNNIPRNIRMLIERFSKKWKGGEFVFTLNQDLLMERWFSEYIHIPFFNDANKITMIRDKCFSDAYDYVVPKNFQTQEPLNAAPGKLHYIKLHGSLNWKSSDGNRRMVIGYNKRKQITDELLLKCYYDIFEKELSQGKPRLLVIRYSFNDEHVNKVIAESDLELHVIDQSEFQSFKDELETKPHGEKIKEEICKGYYHPYTMIEIFPSDGTDSHAWERIKDSFFCHNN